MEDWGIGVSAAIQDQKQVFGAVFAAVRGHGWAAWSRVSTTPRPLAVLQHRARPVDEVTMRKQRLVELDAVIPSAQR